MTDEILSEIRRTRAAYSDRFQGNIAAMLADLEASPDAAGCTVVSFPAKSPTPRRHRNTLLRRKLDRADEDARAGRLIDDEVVFAELLADS